MWSNLKKKELCTFFYGSQMPDVRTIFVKNVQTCENFFKKMYLSQVMWGCYECELVMTANQLVL